LEKINKHLINVQPEQLDQIPHLILIAGTIEKTMAVREILDVYKKNLTCLTTDSIIANELLKQPGND
jgi:DNA-binding transcriptional regulator LsrR (DeoR family)